VSNTSNNFFAGAIQRVIGADVTPTMASAPQLISQNRKAAPISFISLPIPVFALLETQKLPLGLEGMRFQDRTQYDGNEE
jgi:hypothetical protein